MAGGIKSPLKMIYISDIKQEIGVKVNNIFDFLRFNKFLLLLQFITFLLKNNYNPYKQIVSRLKTK